MLEDAGSASSSVQKAYLTNRTDSKKAGVSITLENISMYLNVALLKCNANDVAI